MSVKILLVLVMVVLSSGAAFATPQMPDILIYEGKEYPIHDDPLAEYFTKFPERNPKKADERCSALWRGYRSVYEVSGGYIYLKDVFTNACFGTPTSELKKVVPGGKRLLVDWYSGLLPAMYGHNDADPYSLEALDSFEKYAFFQVTEGKLDEVRHSDNNGYRLFKKKQFEAYKRTKDYDVEVKSMLERNPTMKRSDADWNIEFWIVFQTKKFLFK